jgi:hypothetical protein
MTQNNLGTVLARLGERESGSARLEDAVLDALRDNLIEPELFKEYVRDINRVRGDENARRDQLRSELTPVERRLRQIVEAT